MRLPRVALATLLLVLVVAVGVTWWLTRTVVRQARPRWIVGVLAGTGQVGALDGPTTHARFSEPFGVGIDADGHVYVSDAGHAHRIRRIGPDGIVSTVAGGRRGFVDGPGTAARFATPSAIAVAPDGALLVADTGNHAIRRVTPDGRVSTVAGDGVAGYADGPAAQARFNAPVGVAVAADGRIVVADTYNDRIRVIGLDGQVTTIAGGGMPGLVDGTADRSRLDTPCGVLVDPGGRVLVADTGNGVIRSIDPDGIVSTVSLAGRRTVGVPGAASDTPLPGDVDGAVDAAAHMRAMNAFGRPMALALGRAGQLYVADERGEIAVLPLDDDARLVAGDPAVGYVDGLGPEARFRRPSGIAVMPGGDLVVADAGNALLRLVRRVGADLPSGAAGGLRTRVALVPAAFGRGVAGLLQPPPSPLREPGFDADAFARTPLLWPLAPLDGPHEVAGTFAEARGEAGQERFHAGLDVRQVQGTPARAVRDGIVASPISTGAFETLNEWVRIGDLTYVHIRAGRTRRTGAARAGAAAEARTDIDLARFAPVFDDAGALVRMRVKRGAFFPAGDQVGTLNAFNHVHLNIGWAGEEHNPLRFRLLQFADTVAPSIAPHGIRLFDEAGTALNPDRAGPPRRRGRARRPGRLPPLSPAIVRGRVRIVVDAWDQANGNLAHRRLGVYALGYQVLDRTGAPVAGHESPVETIRFDRMRRDSDAARQVFASGSGIPVYGANRTQFLYVVTTTYRDGIATPGVWDTTQLPPGEYVLRIVARDYHGNEAVANRDLRVVVSP